MYDGRTATIYTSPADSWETILATAGLARAELMSLNPHLEDVEQIEPGIPIDVPSQARTAIVGAAARAMLMRAASPYEIARKELLLNIAEDPRPGRDHPRIRLYHSTTSTGAEPDEIHWCSSFVNFCVEQSGHRGTDSKAARSWLKWGEAVPRDEWREGDVIVFKRAGSSWKGHVGFLVDWQGARPMVLGGNQNDRLSIGTPYSFNAVLGVRRST